jgi:hypothetical protein
MNLLRTAMGLAMLSIPAASAAEGPVPFANPASLGNSTFPLVVSAIDLDRDGDLDIVGSSADRVRWLERNAAGGYALRAIYTYGLSTSIHATVLADLDGDGDQDIVLVRTHDDDEDIFLDWLENDGTPADGEWPRRNVKTWVADLFILDQYFHRALAVADFDGDRDPDIAVGTGEEGPLAGRDGRIDWFENDGTPAGGWTEHEIQGWWDERVPWSLAAGDFDGDGDLDLAAASPACKPGAEEALSWYVNDGSPANGAWTRHSIFSAACGPDLLSLEAGDFDRDGDLDLVGNDSGSFHAYLFENDGTPSEPWSDRRFPSGFDGGFADLDGDGWLDVLIGGPDAWRQNDGAGFISSDAYDLAGGSLQRQTAADLDQDGDPDLVYKGNYPDLGLFWQENLTIHRSARLMPERVIDSAVNEAHDAVAVDLDRDGDLDLVSVSEADDRIVLHRNDGSPGNGGWTNVSAALGVNGARAVAAGDIDGDGDADLVAAAYNENSIFWYESDGTPFDGGWVERTLSSGAGGAHDVTLADLDGDGDLDVAGAQFVDGEIIWYRNNGASPPTFSSFFVDSLTHAGPRAIAAGDIDGDGDVDLAAVSETADAVVWYGNDGTPADGEWFRHRTDSGESDGPRDVALADLDRDSDLDILVSAYVGDSALWFENDGTFAGWTPRTITTCGGARNIAAGDFDRDGDPDVLVSCFDDDTVKLQRSNGASPPDITTTVSTLTGANGARTVLAADLDRDGDLDAAVVQGGDDTVAWYENRGGQFQVGGTSVARNPLYNDQLEPVVRATLTHRGRSGDGPLELTTVPVRLEESAGDPLNALQAASLIDTVRLYGDDGDGTFEPGVDPLVGSVVPAAIDLGGVVFIDVPRGQAAVHVDALAQKTFFVVLDLAQPFGIFASSTDTIRVTLLTGAGPACEAVDADYDVPLQVEWGADVSTATVGLADVVFRDGFEPGGPFLRSSPAR